MYFCQSSFTCHTLWTIHNAIFCSYATQKHLDSKTILGKHIIWYYNTYFNDFSKPNYLIATYHIVLKIIQLCQNKDLFYNQPSSFFILGFIKWSQKSGIYCHPKISMPRVSNLPWTLITCGRSGDLSNLVEACPLANNPDLPHWGPIRRRYHAWPQPGVQGETAQVGHETQEGRAWPGLHPRQVPGLRPPGPLTGVYQVTSHEETSLWTAFTSPQLYSQNIIVSEKVSGEDIIQLEGFLGNIDRTPQICCV